MTMKITRFAALGLAASLVLAACGSADNGDEKTPNDNGGSSQGSDDNESGEPGELTLWLAGGDTPAELRAWLVERMDDDYDVTLKNAEQDWNGLVPMVQTALATSARTTDDVAVGNT